MDSTSPHKRLPGDARPPLADEDPLWQHALQVFDTASRAVRWFATYHIELGMSPAEALKTASGRTRVDTILTSIEHGLPV